MYTLVTGLAADKKQALDFAEAEPNTLKCGAERSAQDDYVTGRVELQPLKFGREVKRRPETSMVIETCRTVVPQKFSTASLTSSTTM